MKINPKTLLLVLIILLAGGLRTYHLGSIPASINADEAAIGYNAYSILKTGKDEYGKPHPLLFQSFDDYKLPLYIYLTVPSVAAFGLNDFSIRLPSAVLGTLTVLATYFLVQVLFGSTSLALVTSFLLAISPWHLQFSRSAYEANIAVFFSVLGIACLVKGLKQSVYSWVGFISLALSVWSYHSSRLFVPLMLIGFFVIYFLDIRRNWKTFLFGFILCILMSIPLALLSVSPEGLVRARGVSALGEPGLVQRNVSWRLTDMAQGIPYSNIYHNHRFVDAGIILKGYLAHYNPAFFFLEAVQGKYHVPGVGLLYLWELPVLLFGFYAAAGMKGKGKYLLFLWFFVAPVAASPTFMLPHPVRTLIFLPTLQVFVALGLMEIYARIYYRRILLVAGIIIVVSSSLFYLHQYYVHAPVEYALEWQYGHEQVVQEVVSRQEKFDKVVVSTALDQPYIFFLYYLRYDPVKYLAYGGTKSGKFDEERNAFDTYEFHRYANSAISLNTLYVGTPEETLLGLEMITEIKDPTGAVVYVLYAK